jgi:Tfp pilus assembly ATPase PilU
MADSFKEANSNLVKKKIENIQIGHLVTAIYGDFSNQKVINGKVVSVIDKGITILSIDKEMVDPVVVPFDTIIDIFEVKKFKKKKNDISMFKINKAIREFFSGNEEELKHAYEQKISVKKLRQELKRKENEKNKD